MLIEGQKYVRISTLHKSNDGKLVFDYDTVIVKILHVGKYYVSCANETVGGRCSCGLIPTEDFPADHVALNNLIFESIRDELK